MFKRSTKITSLLVAAASMVSMVPAMAADVKKIDSEDGKVYKAFAYKDGAAYIDGDIDDKEQVSLYKDGKFNAIEDVDSDSDAQLYGEKYVNVDDGSYYVDLSTGKVTDEDLAEDNEDDAASALRKKIKDDTDDRYNEDDAKNIQDLTVLSGSKYGDIWYKAVLTKADSRNDVDDNYYHLYTDLKGNYIDADYNLGKIKVETTNSSVNIENTKDDVDFGKFTDGKDMKDNLKASISDRKYLTQDDKYIYRQVKITITTTAKTNADEVNETAEIKKVFGIDVSKSNAFDTTVANQVSFDVIQKISKAQASGDVDGAKYAKDVTNYVISKDDGAVYGADSDKYKVVTDTDNNGNLKAEFTSVGDNKLVAYRTISDNNNNKKVETVTIKLDKNKNLYFADLKGKASEDVEYEDSTYAVDVDVDGNLYRLDGGNIYKWDNDEDWDKLYKVDGSMSKLSVYDKDNMVVWDENDEVYSIIGGKTKEEEKPAEEAPTVTAGWNQAADGTYTYVNADGTKATGWFQSPASGKWFYMNPSNGDMMTGWVQVGTTWYYLNPSNGDMQTGWINDGNAWYYCDASGAMLSNTSVDGYVVGANGAWIR